MNDIKTIIATIITMYLYDAYRLQTLLHRGKVYKQIRSGFHDDEEEFFEK